MKYLDQLAEKAHRESVWRLVAFGLMGLSSVLAISLTVASLRLVDAADRTKYILAPGVSDLTVTRPGEFTSAYIEEIFRYVTEKANSWTYKTLSGNYKILYEQFYSHDLVERTRANLDLQNYFEDAADRKLVSLWEIDPSKSEYHWCDKVAGRSARTGVSCGIVTGTRTLYADHNVPVSTKEMSYLIYASSKPPTPKNLFAAEISRIHVGEYRVLKRELETSIKDGTLPKDRK